MKKTIEKQISDLQFGCKMLVTQQTTNTLDIINLKTKIKELEGGKDSLGKCGVCKIELYDRDKVTWFDRKVFHEECIYYYPRHQEVFPDAKPINSSPSPNNSNKEDEKRRL